MGSRIRTARGLKFMVLQSMANLFVIAAYKWKKIRIPQIIASRILALSSIKVCAISKKNRVRNINLMAFI